MATQQVLFAETIAGMKKAFKRKAYESDSDDDIESFTNRGNKLKKKARFTRKGQLVPAEGPSSYKELINYDGFRRSIIHRNPPLVDDEGYEVDSEDDELRVELAAAAAAEQDPYANIRLEQILAPLTASTDLPTHPTLHKPFTSGTLTDLVMQSSGIMRRENHSLWQVRHLWTALCGDGTWMPCETMVGSNDVELYTEDHVARHAELSKSGEGEDPSSSSTVNGEMAGGGQDDAEVDAAKKLLDGSQKASKEAQEDADVSMADADATENKDKSADEKVNGQEQPDAAKPDGEISPGAQLEAESRDSEQQKGDQKTVSEQQAAGPTTRLKTGRGKGTDTADTETGPEGGSTVTLQQEDEMNGVLPLVVSATQEEPFIHPLFLLPAGARPDRDLGLPENEAEDVRRLLAVFVQKQEEVCRGASKLHEGLLRAERLRRDVLHWSKAEAHAGPNRDMSDGEDWYDKEEWGLADDLKKGQDEEEEEATITTGKKTRARR